MRNPAARCRAFTLIELLVVLAVIALLLSIVTPRYFQGVTKAEEATLRQNLHAVRDALDKHYGDTGRYPDSLQELVGKRYLRSVPVDPITRSAESWVLVPPADPRMGLVYEVKSGANGTGLNGTAYETW
jgi:general secretion pathway protein G